MQSSVGYAADGVVVSDGSWYMGRVELEACVIEACMTWEGGRMGWASVDVWVSFVISHWVIHGRMNQVGKSV